MQKPSKILAVAAASAIAITSVYCAAAVETDDIASSAIAKTVYGDVDHNGYVSTADAIKVMKCALGDNVVTAEYLTAAGMPTSGLKLSHALELMDYSVSGSTVRVTGTTVASKTKTLEVGNSFSLGANVTPTTATNKYLSYSTSKSSVAAVDSSGKVTAKAAGTATITATSVDGGYQAKCTVTVKAPQPDGTIQVGGVTYKLCDNYSDSYLYDQRNYSKFNEGNTNVGCSATAEAMGASMYFGTKITPVDSRIIWTQWGAGFGLAKVRYCNKSVSEKLKIAYNQLSKGNPTIINTVNNYSDHWITIVGIKPGASASNLKTSDFLIANPWGATLSNLESYLNSTGRWIPYDYSLRAYE